METFKINDPNNPLFLKVRTIMNLNADTTAFLMVGTVISKPSVAQSEIHENGCIDLDINKELLWTDIGKSHIFSGNYLLIVTTIYGLPSDVETDEDAKKYILENVKIEYALKETNEAEYEINEKDEIIKENGNTALIFKKVQIS